MLADLVHVSAGCNRIVNAFDWGQAGLVAFAAQNSVVIYDVEAAAILTILLGHTGRVNCIRWLHTREEEPLLLVSGAADHTLIVWQLQLQNKDMPWLAAAKLEGHSQALTTVAAHRCSSGNHLLVSAAADDQILVWVGTHWESQASRETDCCFQRCWSIKQSIELPLRLQHSVAITPLLNTADWLLLALGGVDNVVRLYVAAPGQDFLPACILSGHGNWIRSLAFTSAKSARGNRLLLASGSQDKYIRIWAIQEQTSQLENSESTASSTAYGVGHLHIDEGLSRYAPKTSFEAGNKAFRVALEALLIGHEDWVHSVAWQPQNSKNTSSENGEAAQRPCLLSASMDRTMALWMPDSVSGLWMSEESVGDAGPSNLGYFGGAWSPSGDAIMAHGYTGALHLWQRQGQQAGIWTPQKALGGHFAPVTDLTWAFDGTCLLSVSSDQTARITAASKDGSWFEIARPQVHGHDFSSVANIPRSGNRGFLYASGSEEKVIRILEAPKAFLDTLASITGRRFAGPSSASVQEEQALGAAVPALGLSNKAVYASDESAEREGPDLAPRAEPGAVSGRPLEEHLQQSTLWPEIYKVYGHGNEIYSLAADPLGVFLASACKAQTKEVAAVWIWRIGTWTPIQQLEAHTLTVTKLAFSPDGAKLVSVSRDRSIAAWHRTADEQAPFLAIGRVAKAHSRVIWAVALAPDGRWFATGARDSCVKLWSFKHSPQPSLASQPFAVLPTFPSSVHSLALTASASFLNFLAVGLEDGGLQVFQLSVLGEEAETSQLQHQRAVWVAPLHLSHSAAVQRLCWRESNCNDSSGRELLFLASCSDDHAVHVYRFFQSRADFREP